MKKKLSTEFNTRQYLKDPNYEIFYYHDVGLHHISPHAHSHYEFYFLLEGNLDYQIDDLTYDLKPGDFLLIPPGRKHKPLIHSEEIPYRRIVLWFSQAYYERLLAHCGDFAYGYQFALSRRQYRFRHDFITSQDIQGKLFELIEEIQGQQSFHDLHCELKMAAFLAYINRLIYEMNTPAAAAHETPLYLRLCDYINTHLTEDLSLDVLAKEFFSSKYHISHSFKEHMGLGIHQYITKKRLHAIKSGIPFGTPLTQLASDYGFLDYTSFYRAFKKEYDLSPKEYREQHQQIEDYKSL